MKLGEFEILLSRSSAISSSFADCYDLDEYVDVDEDLIQTVQQIRKGIEFLQDHCQEDYQSVIDKLKKMENILQESLEKHYGSYEVEGEEAILLFSNARNIIYE